MISHVHEKSRSVSVASIGVIVVLLATAGALMAYHLIFSGAGSGSDDRTGRGLFFCVDASSVIKSKFVLPAATVAPATQDGKTAVRAHLYTMPDNESTIIVGFVSRWSGPGKARYEELLKRYEGNEGKILEFPVGMEIAVPAATLRWVPNESEAATEIRSRIPAGANELIP
jgi:hypothetical protein